MKKILLLFTAVVPCLSYASCQSGRRLTDRCCMYSIHKIKISFLVIILFLYNSVVFAQSTTPRFQVGQNIDKVWEGDQGQVEKYPIQLLCGTSEDRAVVPTSTRLDPNYVYGIELMTIGNRKILCVKSRRELDDGVAARDKLISQRIENAKVTKANNREKLRDRVDTVAKVLNYSSGCQDEGCDESTWVVKDAKRCVYQNLLLYDMSSVREIYLSSMDPRLISITTEYISGDNRIDNTYNWTTKSYVTTVESTGDNYLVVKYDGKKLFSRKPGDLERLRRGWTLIYGTYCNGVKKEF